MHTANPANVEPVRTDTVAADQVARALAMLLFAVMPVFAIATAQIDYTYLHIRTLGVPVMLFEVLMIAAIVPLRKAIADQAQTITRGTMILAALWFASITISTILAEPFAAHAMQRHILTLIALLFALAVWGVFRVAPETRRLCLVALASGLAVYTVMAYGFALAMADYAGFDWKKFGMGVSNVRHIGYIAICLTGLSLALFLGNDTRRDERIALGLFAIGVFLVMWSGGRTAAVALLVQMVLTVAIAQRGKRRRIATYLIGITAIATALASLYVPPDYYGPQSIFARIDAATIEKNLTTHGRPVLWAHAAEFWPQRAWFGHGEGQFRYTLPEGISRFNHPHNLFLQLLFQWGIIGSALFAGFIGRLLWVHRRSVLERRAMALPAIMVLSGLGAIAMLDGPFFYQIPVLVTIVALCALTAEPARATFRKTPEQFAQHQTDL